MKSKIFSIIIFMLIIPRAFSLEHFVRIDGGTWDQCNGQVDVPYSEDITNRACAVKHIFELLDPEKNKVPEGVRINGGDIITILNNADGSAAEYTMGAHDDYDQGGCSSSWNYGCYMPSIPSGTKENPTIIRGHRAGETCATKPILWGYGRLQTIFRMINNEYIQLSCLTLTDKSSCIGSSGFPNSDLICDRDAPYDKPFADTGIYMEDASNILLKDLQIEGLSTGIKAGRLENITLNRVNLFANHSAGWNGDISLEGSSSSNSGTIKFLNSTISFNGCGLIYNPGEEDHRAPHACSSQEFGGYGDGIGTASTGGHWIFDNVKVMHNSSDGIDLLYQAEGGKTVITNSHLEGNAGNQLKVSGNAEITNNIIMSSCYWNSRQDEKLGGSGENCRALGNALSLSYTHADTNIHLLNNTIISEGDCLISSGDRTDIGAFNQGLYIVNNSFYGLFDQRAILTNTPGDDENTCLYYTESPFPITQIHNNLIHQPKNFGVPCTNFQSTIPEGGTPGICTTASGPFFDNDDRTIESNPHYSEMNLGVRYSSYDVTTIENESNTPAPDNENSPLVDAGYSGEVAGLQTPLTDYYGRARTNKPDIGVIEFTQPVATPEPPVILSVEFE